MRKEKVSALSVLEMIPEEELSFLSASTKVDYKVHKLSGRTMFQLLVYSLVNNHSVSLRVMEEVFSSARFAALNPEAEATTTRFTSIRDRIHTIKADYFKGLFEYCSQRFSKQLAGHKTLVAGGGDRQQQGDSAAQKGTLLRFDSTMIALSAKLLLCSQVGGMRVGSKTDKAQIKITIGFNGLFPTKAKLFSDQKELNEDLTIPALIKESSLEAKDVVVFDRGVKKRSTLHSFAQRGIGFVTRLKVNTRYENAGPNRLSEPVRSGSLLLTEDRPVYLFDGKSNRSAVSFRLIRAEDIESGEPVLFLTNLSEEDFDGEDISSLYKRRWDIEVFFKFLKQELDLGHLPVRSQNGIEVVLYAKLITAMLLTAYKVFNELEGYKIAKLRFANELQYELTKIVVILCGGDPDKFSSKFKERSFVH